MSNGLKVGILIVIAGVLGFLAYTQLSKKGDDISGREAKPSDGAISHVVNSNTTGNTAIPVQTDATLASQNRTKTTLKFDKEMHDFGTIKQGESVECTFKVTNTGSEPLIIEDAKGSCGCTVPDYPKEPILAGQTKDIKVKFNSAGKSNNQQKTVTLTANTEPLNSILTIKAFVEAPEDGQKK